MNIELTLNWLNNDIVAFCRAAYRWKKLIWTDQYWLELYNDIIILIGGDL